MTPSPTPQDEKPYVCANCGKRLSATWGLKLCPKCIKEPNGFELQEDGTVTSPTDNTEELRKQIVSRFLRWELPTDFSPDAGISYKPLPKHFGRPIGTNLLSSIQARQMVDFILDVVPPTMEEDEAIAELYMLMGADIEPHHFAVKVRELIASSNHQAVQAFGEKALEDTKALELSDYNDTDAYQQGYMWAVGQAVSVITSLMEGELE